MIPMNNSMKQKRSQTPNRGAVDERVAILRKVREMRGQAQTAGHAEALDHLIEWIQGRPERATQKAGGLGRR